MTPIWSGRCQWIELDAMGCLVLKNAGHCILVASDGWSLAATRIWVLPLAGAWVLVFPIVPFLFGAGRRRDGDCLFAFVLLLLLSSSSW